MNLLASPNQCMPIPKALADHPIAIRQKARITRLSLGDVTNKCGQKPEVSLRISEAPQYNDNFAAGFRLSMQHEPSEVWPPNALGIDDVVLSGSLDAVASADDAAKIDCRTEDRFGHIFELQFADGFGKVGKDVSVLVHVALEEGHHGKAVPGLKDAGWIGHVRSQRVG